ncbi:MAG: hypothetical protein U1F67_14175 [Rubrivivax sp.]
MALVAGGAIGLGFGAWAWRDGWMHGGAAGAVGAAGAASSAAAAGAALSQPMAAAGAGVSSGASAGSNSASTAAGASTAALQQARPLPFPPMCFRATKTRRWCWPPPGPMKAQRGARWRWPGTRRWAKATSAPRPRRRASRATARDGLLRWRQQAAGMFYASATKPGGGAAGGLVGWPQPLQPQGRRWLDLARASSVVAQAAASSSTATGWRKLRAPAPAAVSAALCW